MDIMNGLLGFGDKLYQAFLVEDRGGSIWTAGGHPGHHSGRHLHQHGAGHGALPDENVPAQNPALARPGLHRYHPRHSCGGAAADYVQCRVLNVTDNKMVVAVIAFGLNSSAYMAEIYRSGINAVDPGQMEARPLPGPVQGADHVERHLPPGAEELPTHLYQ